ncbi:hypothetical protein SEA_REINDEER_75 [Mycobacterium phage Reindeer]|uniref:Uncharacterized protein n=1 Tax=Mycobacterium phage Reindeer TaxID=2762283 RepID=A0A7G8LI13_9CAUD|nr:hypothetical protein J4U05_gp075 [Mycobacterium phage Reindeer]QNJ56885.1 hypothetical protein SEA_REINDEER_75 [Mycobacterium phage Reindeer]
MSEQCWGGTLSTDGHVQVLQQELAQVRYERDLVARQLGAVQRLINRWMQDAGPGTRMEQVYGPQTISVAFMHRAINEVIADA